MDDKKISQVVLFLMIVLSANFFGKLLLLGSVIAIALTLDF